MNQAISSDVKAMVQQAMGLWRDAGLSEAATITILRRPNPPNTDASGGVDYTYTAVYTALACQFAVESVGSPDQGGVTPMPDRFATRQDRHCLIDGYYPLIRLEDVADITILASGVTTRYQVKAVESDSLANMTRLACCLETQ